MDGKTLVSTLELNVTVSVVASPKVTLPLNVEMPVTLRLPLTVEVDEVKELTLFDLEAIADEYTLDLMSLLFKPLFHADHIAKKLKDIKLLILDVDGVMTDGGMYWTESGDQIKKFKVEKNFIKRTGGGKDITGGQVLR